LLAATFLGLAMPATAQARHLSGFALIRVTPEWRGPVFRTEPAVSADRSIEATPAPTYPWQQIDFRVQPAEYIKAVYDYVLEGNREVDWAVQDNSVRRWYHAPWMHYGDKGREFVRGLTRETLHTGAAAGRRPVELGPQQPHAHKTGRSAFSTRRAATFSARSGPIPTTPIR
jgi:hypothetical protein